MDLERYKKARTPLRAMITKAVDKIEEEAVSDTPGMKTLHVLLKRLEQYSTDMDDLDQKILGKLLDIGVSEEDYEAEMMDIAKYRDKISGARWRIDTIGTQPHSDRSPTGSYDSVFSADSSKKKCFKLPKIQIPKFDGDLRSWLGWWSQFEKIDQDEDLHDSDKFQYLIQATEAKSEARSIISAFPPTGENYSAAIDSLKKRYGREGLQLQVYLRELLSLVIVNVTSKEKISLDTLYLKLRSHLRALKTLDLSNAEPDLYFYPLVESSLPAEVLRAWLRSPAVVQQDGKPSSKLEDLMSFLEKEVEGEQQISLAQSGFLGMRKSEGSRADQDHKKSRASQESGHQVTAAALYASEAKNKCIFCDKSNHPSQSCFGLKRMTIEEKNERMKAAQVCSKCLKKGHRSKECKSSVKFTTCGRSHHTSPCYGKKEDQSVQELAADVQTLTTSHTSALSKKTMSEEDKIVLRGTLLVKVFGPNNKMQRARVLIDPGSDASYIRQDLANTLKLKPSGKRMFHTEVFGGRMEVCERNEYLVKVGGLSGGSETLNMFSEVKICGECGPVPQGPWIQKLMKMKVYLSDTYDSGEIDILIGADHLGSIQTGRMIKLEGLTATETTVGWYLNGKVSVAKSQNLAAKSIVLATKAKDITALWELDALGITESPETTSQVEQDARVKAEFQKGLTGGNDGRYIVKLPWVSEVLPQPTNRAVAEKRLVGPTTKLISKNEFENYDSIFRAWEAEGIIEEVTGQDENSGGHYLPHRPVFKPESLTTPVRPVSDASCKIGKHPSLNQCLEKGPNMVGNRVRNILQLTKKEDWRHVPGKMNPADLPSRGCSPQELLESKWWEGPSWLRLPEEEWPHVVQDVHEEEVTAEKRKNASYAVSSNKPHVWEPRFTSYQKNVRITAYAIRILRGVKFPEIRSVIKLPELREAELYLWNLLQKRYFSDPKKIQVRVERSEDGLLRVKSKLEYKDDLKAFRNPILIPNECPLVYELILEVHRAFGHGGIQFTLTKLREKYWIPQSRRTVTKALRKCITCRKQDAKPLQVDPVALPEKRVTPGEVFTTTGVDLAGPLFLKDKTKVWVVLYTCAVYRCVTLDLVDSLDSESFIRSLQRFVMTHGRPETIYSDNGTNFVGAQNLFNKLDWAKIETKMRAKQIQWIFNPATAAWWGGWWERLVGSMKGLLRRMLGKAALTRDELVTCLSVAAATINERPLTVTTEDEEDLIPLTPSMFLKGTKMARFPEVEHVSGKDLQLRFKYVRKLQVDLQNRFRKEYLGQLVQKRGEKKTKDPQVGDIVLVGADNKKRFEWPLGRILKLNPGKDGKYRSAVVKTGRRVLSRPLQRLYPLEISTGNELSKPEKQESCENQDEVIGDEDPEVDDIDDTKIGDVVPEVVTKSGREVKKPQRYVAWFKK